MIETVRIWKENIIPPKEEKVEFCSPIGRTKMYCIYCRSIQEFDIIFWNRDFTLHFSCRGRISKWGCHWDYMATTDKIDQSLDSQLWKVQPRRTVYDTKNL